MLTKITGFKTTKPTNMLFIKNKRKLQNTSLHLKYLKLCKYYKLNFKTISRISKSRQYFIVTFYKRKA